MAQENASDISVLESTLNLLKIEAVNFGARYINDVAVRQDYIKRTSEFANGLLEEVKQGRMTAKAAADEANKVRNAIMDAARIKSSDIGRAKAESLKATGKTLAELEEYYAQKLFKQSFKSLSESAKNQVWLQIVEASGRTRPTVNVQTARWSALGRSLIFISVAVAVYNVTTAENKGRQVVKEGATAGAGILGGMAGGAAAGLICGPGAPVCVGVGVFIGGAAAALGMDIAFDKLW